MCTRIVSLPGLTTLLPKGSATMHQAARLYLRCDKITATPLDRLCHGAVGCKTHPDMHSPPVLAPGSPAAAVDGCWTSKHSRRCSYQSWHCRPHREACI